jgi:hypothetical protein
MEFFNISTLAYFASIIILISFLLKDQIKLRALNSIGSSLFIVYAITRSDYPVIFINLSIILINIIFIFKSLKNAKK